MLGMLKERRPEPINHEFRVGDLVWGKVMPHPWWPGQILDETFASPSIRRTKRDGHLLVAFFGDYTYGWLDPKEILPFDLHYVEKCKQTTDRPFMKALDEAIYEVRRRAVTGLVCHCRIRPNVQIKGLEGYSQVDASGYTPGAIDSVEQILNSRDGFRPREILHFVQHIALNPRSDAKENFSWLKNSSETLAYRKAKFEVVDPTYPEAFGFHVKISIDSKRAPQGSMQQKDDSCEIGQIEEPPQVPILKSSKSLHGRVSDVIMTREGSGASRAATSIFQGLLNDLKSLACDPLCQAGEHNAASVKEAILRFRSKVSLGSASSGEFEQADHRQDRSHATTLPVRASRHELTSLKPTHKRPKADGNLPPRKKHGLDCSEEVMRRKRDRTKEMKSLTSEKKTGGQKFPELQPSPSVEAENSSKKEFQPPMTKTEPTTLVLQFPPRANLPSISELKAKFARYGPFDESAIRVFWGSSICHVVFRFKSNAKAALDHALRNRFLFSCPIVQYCLQVSESKDKDRFGQTRPQKALFRSLHSLPHSKVQRKSVLLHFPPFSNIPHVNGLPFFQWVDHVQMRYRRYEAMDNHKCHSASTSSKMEISGQMIDLLFKTSEIMAANCAWKFRHVQ